MLLLLCDPITTVTFHLSSDSNVVHSPHQLVQGEFQNFFSAKRARCRIKLVQYILRLIIDYMSGTLRRLGPQRLA